MGMKKLWKIWGLVDSLFDTFYRFQYFEASVTRLGDFLQFGQPFKAGGNNYFTQITHIARQFL